MEIMHKEKNNRLGRGLDSLLGSSSLENQVLFLDIEKVSSNPEQPRKSFSEEKLQGLAESIKNHGILQPIIVRSLGHGIYQIIAGERRWRASQRAGLLKIPAIVKNPKKEEEPILSLLENLQRQDLNPLEEAKAYSQILEERDLRQEDLAKSLGIPRSSLVNFLRLLKLDERVQKWISEEKISLGQAKEILKLKDPLKQRAMGEKCIKNQMTVRKLHQSIEQDSKKEHDSKKEQKEQAEMPSYLALSLDNLEKKLHRKVSLDFKKRKGKISFSFIDEEDLKNFLDKLWKMKT